jgi:hypothetical protein
LPSVTEVGIGTSSHSLPLEIKASGITLRLQETGGAQLRIANNLNDNRIWREAFNTTGRGSAAEMPYTESNDARRATPFATEDGLIPILVSLQ